MSIEQKLKPIWFVSLGPGDNKLLTIRARQKLEEAERIFIPETINNSISVSKSKAIIDTLDVPIEKLNVYHLPMTNHGIAAYKAYCRIAVELEKAYLKGEKVVLAAEGDVSIYSSAQSIAGILKEKGIPVRFEAGIPSFIEAASRFGIPLIRYTESLVVCSNQLKKEGLNTIAKFNDCIILMKVSRNQEVIKDFILKFPDYDYYYAERIGMPGEFLTKDKSQIIKRNFPYFALLIIKK